MSDFSLNSIIDRVCNRIAPAWPLENSVAVNPYLGLSELSFELAAKVMRSRGGIDMYMPVQFYMEKLDKGEITGYDISMALKKNKGNVSVSDFIYHANNLCGKKDAPKEAITFTSRSVVNTRTDYSKFFVDQLSGWLALYYNKFQSSSDFSSLYSAWKSEASIDLLPELNGLSDFRKHVSELPEHEDAAIARSLKFLKVESSLVEAYLHSLLLKLIGWSSYCAGEDWQSNLYKENGGDLKGLLAIMVAWEACYAKSLDIQQKTAIEELKKAHSRTKYSDLLTTQHILQNAYDYAAQRELKAHFSETQITYPINYIKRPKAQITFCIDVRSEVFRRNLEKVDSEIETIGFAGFFGMPIKYKPMSHSEGKNQCPVLIPSGPVVKETTCDHSHHDKEEASRTNHGKRRSSWLRFKSGTVSAFSFVSPVGLFFLPKLISDSMGWSRPVQDPKQAEFGELTKGQMKLDLSEIALTDQIQMAKSTLVGMGLTEHFAPLVLFAGHGSSSVNNPHATGLDCGACGGNSGEVNAMTAQAILNNQEVRKGLSEQHSITIPNDTHFVSCVHDTTTDEITIINEKAIPDSHSDKMAELKEILADAGKYARLERSKRMQGMDSENVDAAIFKNANDWSQVRPEWGLSGCNSFIIAPRERTKNINLSGRAFLHNYKWKMDRGFQILESIITAPMIVTSWINLQYYASTVDNEKLGAGNKTLHNATGGMGVLEGAKGDLRIGLPMQSIHDGKDYQHLPQKLNVIIEAPIEAINNILEKHPNVKDLCDNEWITIMTLNRYGKLSHRYSKDLRWDALDNQEVKKESIDKEHELVEV